MAHQIKSSCKGSIVASKNLKKIALKGENEGCKVLKNVFQGQTKVSLGCKGAPLIKKCFLSGIAQITSAGHLLLKLQGKFYPHFSKKCLTLGAW